MTSTKLRVLDSLFIFLSQLSLGCAGNHFIKERESIFACSPQTTTLAHLLRGGIGAPQEI